MNEQKVVLRVVTFLGLIGVMLAGGVIGLTLVALKEGKLDSAAVALVAGVSSLAGVALGSLGTMLVNMNTHGGATPVAVTNASSEPVPVEAA